MIRLKSPREIGLMREAGRVIAGCLQHVGGILEPGITTAEIEAQFGLEVALYIQGALAIGAGLAALFVVETNPRVLERRALVGAAA